MAYELKEYVLEQLVDFINGYAFKSSDYVRKDGDAYEVLRMGYIKRGGGYKEDETKVYAPKSVVKNIDRFLLRKNDIVMAMTDMKNNVAILGNTALITHSNRFVVNQRVGVLRVKDEKVIDPIYLYYLTNNKTNVEELRTRANSGVQVNLSTDAIKKTVYLLPPISVQNQISKILHSLDKKIELLKETNQTLESIAQTIFKSWFVDFDPVHSKAQGRKCAGIDDATAKLFPDSFVDSELGKIPKDWEVKSIYAISEIIYGAPFASKLFNNDGNGIPILRIRDLKDENPVVHTTEKHIKGYLLKQGDIVVGMDGEFRAYLWGGNQVWLNQRVCVFKPLANVCSAFVHLSIKPLLAKVEASETATTVIHIGKNDFDRFRILIPSSDILDRFSLLTNPIYKAIVNNKQSIKTLSALRDTLLPRLISGKLDLSDIEEQLEGVA